MLSNSLSEVYPFISFVILLFLVTNVYGYVVLLLILGNVLVKACLSVVLKVSILKK